MNTNVIFCFILLIVLCSICLYLGYEYGRIKTTIFFNNRLRKIDKEMDKLTHSLDDFLHKLIAFKIIDIQENDK